MAAERGAGGGGELEVDGGAVGEVGEGGAGEGLGGEVGGEARGEGVGLDVERGEADAVDGDAVACAQFGGERGCGDGDAGVAVGAGEGEQRPRGLNQSGEHDYKGTGLSWRAGRARNCSLRNCVFCPALPRAWT